MSGSKSMLAHHGEDRAAPQEMIGLSDLVSQQIAAYFSAHEEGLPSSGLYARMIREVERPLFVATLAACRGNQIRAAALLGINRNTLRKKMAELGLAMPSLSTRTVRLSLSKAKQERGRRTRGLNKDTKDTKHIKDV